MSFDLRLPITHLYLQTFIKGFINIPDVLPRESVDSVTAV